MDWLVIVWQTFFVITALVVGCILAIILIIALVALFVRVMEKLEERL